MYQRILYKDHGEKKRRTEGVTTADVRSILEDGLGLRRYPEDQPLESYLVLG